jgi:hypothetical protein
MQGQREVGGVDDHVRTDVGAGARDRHLVGLLLARGGGLGDAAEAGAFGEVEELEEDVGGPEPAGPEGDLEEPGGAEGKDGVGAEVVCAAQ